MTNKNASQGSDRSRIIHTFLKNRTAIIGAFVAVLLIFIATLGPYIVPHDPIKQHSYTLTPPGEHGFLLGTDRYGRDVFSRVIYGLRISMFVGVLSVISGLIAGSAIGIIAGYSGGYIDGLLMRSVDLVMTFPDEVFGVMFMIAFANVGIWGPIIAIGILMTPRFARLTYEPAKG